MGEMGGNRNSKVGQVNLPTLLGGIPPQSPLSLILGEER